MFPNVINTEVVCLFCFTLHILVCFILFCKNFGSGTDGNGILQELFQPEYHSQEQPTLECFNVFGQNFESGTDSSGILQKLFQPVFRSQKQPSLVCFNFFDRNIYRTQRWHLQSLTKAIILELFYYINGYFRALCSKVKMKGRK